MRRLKTDKCHADLPDKTEIKTFCLLRLQAGPLYQQAAQEFSEPLANVIGIERRGLVVSFLLRFKQICNHPSRWLWDAAWEETDSSRWALLREIAEVIAAKQEVPVFTSFREVSLPLAAFLGPAFGRPRLVLNGNRSQKGAKSYKHVAAVLYDIGAGWTNNHNCHFCCTMSSKKTCLPNTELCPWHPEISGSRRRIWIGIGSRRGWRYRRS